MKNAITSYRALDLENDTAEGSHIGFPRLGYPGLNNYDRVRLTSMAYYNEENKNVGWHRI